MAKKSDKTVGYEALGEVEESALGRVGVYWSDKYGYYYGGDEGKDGEPVGKFEKLTREQAEKLAHRVLESEKEIQFRFGDKYADIHFVLGDSDTFTYNEEAAEYIYNNSKKIVSPEELVGYAEQEVRNEVLRSVGINHDKDGYYYVKSQDTPDGVKLNRIAISNEQADTYLRKIGELEKYAASVKFEGVEGAATVKDLLKRCEKLPYDDTLGNNTNLTYNESDKYYQSRSGK